MTKDEILKAIDDEPELPGTMPDDLRFMFRQAIIHEDSDFFVVALITAVRLTKEGIRQRILERYR